MTPAERADVIDGYRLVHTADAPVNWCPGLGTVLANEEVTNDGRSDRGNYPVFKRNLRQWMMRITAYADRLDDDLDRVSWPEHVKTMQRNWIGRSHGALIAFPSEGGPIDVFTTRPGTVFGTTFMVLAPEHPLVDAITPTGPWPQGTDESWTDGAGTPEEAVAAYLRDTAVKTDIERQAEGKDKTGVFTGGYATNPANGQRIPVFVADYVLMGYGTGAIMGVPGQDQRDWDFAERLHLPIVRTVKPPEGHPENLAYVGEGPAINSANDDVSLDGLGIEDAKTAIIEWLTEKGFGEAATTYKLRDWLFARQRYWGEPFPVLFDDDGIAHAVPESMLPVELPEVPDYTPATFDPNDADAEPEAPLAHNQDWVNVELDLGDGNGRRHFRRDTNVMPQWAGSCWYYLRYLDPANDEALVDPANERYWMGPHDEPVVPGTRDPGGVDLYVGGVEHAVLHLLYARFWHKVLYDLGHVSSDEPFRTYFSQGYILAPAFNDSRGRYVPADEVEEHDGLFTWHGRPVSREFGKMGKSLKNIVSPDDMYAAYGADTFRLYEMGMGPLDQSKPWETRAVVGSQRFLQRLWRTIIDEDTGEVIVVDDPPDIATSRVLHRTIDAVGHDYEHLSFNTAIARLTELVNTLTKLDGAPREVAEPLVLMVAPLAPHIAEELWSRLGHGETLTYEPFPVADPDLLVTETVTCVVQIDGKVRDRIEVPIDITEDSLRDRVLDLPKVATATTAGVSRVIVRAPRLVNVVPS